MKVIEISPTEYLNIFPSPYFIFNSVEFNLLNAAKGVDVRFFLFSDSKVRFGIIGGIINGIFKSPFSAPSGGFSFKSNTGNFEQIDQSLIAIEDYLLNAGVSKISLIYPPSFYNKKFITKLINAHYRHNYQIKNIEVDFYFNTNNFDNNYSGFIKYNARKNLQASLKNSLHFHKIEDVENQQRVYDIILINRTIKGNPLKMTFDQMVATTKLINADFFLVTHDNLGIASAVVFYVAPSIVQVIYWGDNPEYSGLRSMNFLSFKLFEYYKSIGISIIDIGHSTENSIPNIGLCDFKESIGCDLDLKFSFEKTLNL